MKRRRGKLTRSLSASRSSTTTKVDRKRTVSEIIRSDMAVAEGVSGGVEKKMSGGEDSHLSVVAVNTSSSVVAAAAAAAAAVGGGVGGGRGGVGGELEVRTARSAYGKTSEDLQTEALATLLVLDKAKGLECLKVMRGYMATCWWFVQPLLFCLIGADIPVEKLRADTIGRGIASILISLSFRMGASILAVTPSPLKWKERIFVAVAWIPKATVQAAIGPLALDSARATGDRTLINWGEQLWLTTLKAQMRPIPREWGGVRGGCGTLQAFGVQPNAGDLLQLRTFEVGGESGFNLVSSKERWVIRLSRTGGD
ncbi:Sodium/hydrogen exchanger 9B2 [Taenia crassiceps]|uniref:Sodium/hydrogen exchanger 9B2 n=1 Tax=Taenia crassiceps TaxID=6207 RepID=A0ABR4Q6V1_9CEST